VGVKQELSIVFANDFTNSRYTLFHLEISPAIFNNAELIKIKT